MIAEVNIFLGLPFLSIVRRGPGWRDERNHGTSAIAPVDSVKSRVVDFAMRLS